MADPIPATTAYRIKKTDLLHGGKLLAEGSIVELTDAHAAPVKQYLEAIPAEQVAAARAAAPAPQKKRVVVKKKKKK